MLSVHFRYAKRNYTTKQETIEAEAWRTSFYKVRPSLTPKTLAWSTLDEDVVRVEPRRRASSSERHGGGNNITEERKTAYQRTLNVPD